MADFASRVVPTSPTSLVFSSSGPNDKNMRQMSGGGEGSAGEGKDGGGDTEGGGKSYAERNKGKIQQKEFFWDQFLIYIATIVALLTVLDVTLQFFRGGGLVCRVPGSIVGEDNRTIELTRDEVTYVNTFCQQSLSLAEYYPLFVLIQGLVLAAPQYLWAALFGGQFDFFFGLVRQLDRLRSSETGEYRSQNFEIVKKLEKHFPRKWKLTGIFSLYVLKLFLQLLVVIISILINATVFQEHYFAFSFKCPKEFDPESPPEGWWLPFKVVCVFSSFRLHQRLQMVNYLLLVLALGTIIFGLFWCIKRHANALGYKEIALFAFSSSLRPEEYIHASFWKSPLTPGIRSDLDFLLMRLYRADSGYGNVFKDIQVQKRIKREVGKDHEYLYLYLDAIKDRAVKPKLLREAQRLQGEEGAHTGITIAPTSELGGKYRSDDLRDYFIKADLSSNPDKEVYDQLKKSIGNTEWTAIPGIRNFVFGFLGITEKHILALDISFGTIGYSLILARAFQEVISLNFHPFYANEKEICRKDEFHTNYCTIKFQEDILTTRTDSLKKVDETVGLLFKDDSVGKREIKANFVVVGPFTDKAKVATVNLFIERQHTAERFAKGSVLMYLRPLEIGPRNVSSHFCEFEPPSNLFERDMKDVDKKMTEANISYETVYSMHKDREGKKKEYKGIKVTCNKTECIFEFTLYRFIGTFRALPNEPPGGGLIPPGGFQGGERGSSQAGNIALIIPSQMLPELAQNDIQRFLDGEGAIQLHARSPGNPLQFVFPTATANTEVPNNDSTAVRRRRVGNAEWAEANVNRLSHRDPDSRASSYHSLQNAPDHEML